MENQLMIKHSIVLVPFPFDDFSSAKVRPALCLTSEIGGLGHVIIAFISSNIPEDKLESDIEINLGTTEWSGTGLASDSVIRLHKIVTIPKYLIKRRLGKLNASMAELVRSKIFRLLDN
jgi:mRNA interferase MazF